MNEPPVVKYMVMCEDARSEGSPERLNVYGLTPQLAAPGGTFPIYMRTLCALVVLRNGRGTGIGQVLGIHADTGVAVCRSPSRRLLLGNDPLRAHAAKFTVRMVRFPAAGAYTFEFRYDDAVLATQSFDVVEDRS
jgi:hypothetical protein